jgi:large subunit ribosomal protein L3
VWKNQRMPGHMGTERRTIQNLKVVQVREDEGLILISGSVPGSKGSYVVLRPGKKASTTATATA